MTTDHILWIMLGCILAFTGSFLLVLGLLERSRRPSIDDVQPLRNHELAENDEMGGLNK